MLDDGFMREEEIDMKKELVRKNHMKTEDDCHYQTVHSGGGGKEVGFQVFCWCFVGVFRRPMRKASVVFVMLGGSSILSS